MTPRSSSPALAERPFTARVVAVAAVAAFVAFLVIEVPVSIRGNPDFPNYYFGGERLLEGRPVYDDLREEVADRLGVAYEVYPADPPLAVLVLSPLSLLSYQAAWLLLASVSVGVTSFVMYRVGREVGMTPHWSLALVGVSLISTNFRFLIARNHMESLLLLVGYLGWRALRANRDAQGGIWWGLAAVLKLFPALWLFGLAAARRRRSVLVGLAAAFGLGAVGVVLVGWSESVRFVVEIVPRSRQWYGALGNYSLVSFGAALVGHWFGWLLALAAAVGLGSWFLRRPGGPDRIWAAGTALALLLSPLAWHNYMVLTFPCLVLVGSRLALDSLWPRVGFVGLVAGLGFWGPIVVSSEVISVLMSFAPTYALLALFVLSMRALPEQGDASWPSTSEIPFPTSR